MSQVLQIYNSRYTLESCITIVVLDNAQIAMILRASDYKPPTLDGHWM